MTQFSVRSLMLFAAIVAVVLSFVSVAGAGRALSHATLTPVLAFTLAVWALGWALPDTRRRIRFVPVALGGMCLVALAGLIYYCLVVHVFDPAAVAAHTERVGKGDSRFQVWMIWAGCIGAFVGATYSFMVCRHTRTIASVTNDEQARSVPAANDPTADG